MTVTQAALDAAAATRAAIIAAMAARSGRAVSSRLLVWETGRAKATVNRALHAMVAEGVVVADRASYDRRSIHYRLADSTLK
jgi:DNA-binding IclR family transcriptional regulator